MDVITYALLNKKLKSLISGVNSVVVKDNTITWNFVDGTSASMSFKAPEDGKSITDIQLDEAEHLICTISDGTSIDAGKLPQAVIKISKKEGNILKQFEDGLYVPSSPIKIDDTLIIKEDGSIGLNPTQPETFIVSEEDLNTLFN